MMNAADTDVTFSDMNISEQRLVGRTESFPFTRKGWFITRCKALILLLVVLLLCVIIGVSVHYAAKRQGGETEVCMQQTTAAPHKAMTSPKPTEALDIRLPEALRPLHYDVNIRPDIYGDNASDFRFTGSVKILMDAVTNTDDIIVHSNNLTIDHDSIKVFVQNDNKHLPVDLVGVKLIPEPHEFLKIPLKESLVTGKTYQLEIAFAGTIERDLRGIYYSSYVDKEGKTVYLLTSQLQATDARKVFPCFDEPALKATFNISIDHKDTLSTKSNTVLLISKSLQDGWIRDVYEQTPKMSTYLLAFLVSNFTCSSNQTSTGTLIEVCARPTAAEQTQYAMSIAVDLQEWFESYHNISYPLSKMSHVAVPDFSAGAMENWGLILYRETALLYDAVTAPSASAMQRVALVVAHELAHQWFGNLVTPMWWDDIWLNEGFASFMELLSVDSIKDYHTWNIEAQSVSDQLQKVMIEDSLMSSHPVYQPVEDPAEINSLFDKITYDKGSSVIRMMRYFLGDETFRMGLSDYLKARQFQAADHEDLFTFLTQRAAIDGKILNMTAIMNTWILQAGYPVVDFHFQPGDTEIKLSQKRYLLDPNANTNITDDYLWRVPITYTSDKKGVVDTGNLTVTWLKTASGSIPDIVTDTQWVLGNVKQAFYYRVNYDIENWNSLVDVLLENPAVIPASSRSQLIDDSFKLGRSGLVDQILALNLTRYLEKEEDYPPWYSVYSNLKYMERMLYQVDADHLLQKYIQEKISNLYHKYSVDEETVSYTHIQKKFQALMMSIACRYELDSCLQNATQQYQAWMAAVETNQTYNINPNYAAVVYCYAISQGGVEEWDFGYKMYMQSNSGSQKELLLSALGCSKTPWILQRYLKWALDEDSHGFHRQDMRRILQGISTRAAGTHIAWGFFKANWDTYLKRFGEQSFAFPSMIAGITASFSTDWEEQDFAKFFMLNSNQAAAQRQVQQSHEEIKANIQWRKNHGENIMNWLKEQLSS